MFNHEMIRISVLYINLQVCQSCIWIIFFVYFVVSILISKSYMVQSESWPRSWKCQDCWNDVHCERHRMWKLHKRKKRAQPEVMLVRSKWHNIVISSWMTPAELLFGCPLLVFDWPFRPFLYFFSNVELSAYGGTFGQGWHTFIMMYYTAWRKMDFLTSQIVFISSVPITPSSQDSRGIWPSFLLAGMIIPSGQSIAFHQTSCGNLGCCSTPSESHRDMKKIWQLSINGNVLVLLSAICRFLKSFTYALLYFRKSKLRALIGRVQGYPIITTQVFWCQKWNVHWMLKILNLYAFP